LNRQVAKDAKVRKSGERDLQTLSSSVPDLAILATWRLILWKI